MITDINRFNEILENKLNIHVKILTSDEMLTEYTKDTTISKRIRYFNYNNFSYDYTTIVNPFYVVLYHNDYIIGICMCGYFSNQNINSQNTIYSISYFSIDKDYRYKGYANLICDELFKYAKNMNYTISTSAYTVLGKAQLEKLFIKYADKYNVTFINNDNMHDYEKLYVLKNGKKYHYTEV